MEGFDPSDLITVCRIISHDGRLSVDGVYKLTEYLNEHPDALNCWPGDVLAGVLRDSCRGGVVDEDGLFRVGQVLAQIEVDFVRRHDELIGKWLRVDSARLEECLGVGVPVVPQFEWSGWHRSRSAGDQYWVDLSDLSCSCPDWIQCRKGIPPRSLGRCCKHVVLELSRIVRSTNSPPWMPVLLAHYVDGAKGVRPEEKWILLQLGCGDAVIAMGWNEWANAFAIRFGSYGRWGFNKVERRWSHGLAPDAARVIAEVIIQNDDGMY